MGTPLPGYALRLRTADGTDAATGELGQLLVRGPVGTTYWGHPDAADEVARRQAATTVDGWVLIGDWVTRDEDGYVRFVARAEDLLVRGDIRFGPIEVEAALETHPAVAEAGVFRADTDRIGALVVLRPGYAGTDELRSAIRTHAAGVLGPDRTPDDVSIVRQLPRTPFGTLRRRAEWPALLAGATTPGPA
jgi:acyl-coenzyme A synthetase/AMP-(fatty) acid ligase